MSICIVPLELNPVVESTVIVPDPVMAVPWAIALLAPLAISVEAELNIFSPLAASILLAKLVTMRTCSSDELVWGTICSICFW